MERMEISCLPKCLLVSRPVRGKRSVGSQKKRWNDVVVSDFKRGELLEDWREIAQDRGAWRCLVTDAVEAINEQAEAKEKERKDERKRRREESLPLESSSWQCNVAGCVCVGQSKAGLVNHTRQVRGWMAGVCDPCPTCGRLVRRQGIIMHKRFCRPCGQIQPQPAPS